MKRRLSSVPVILSKAPLLADYGDSRDNNFNLIRLLAAAGVLVSHAFPITLGPDAVQPLERWLGVTMGTVSVYVFFAISGFLIARSFDRQTTVWGWVAARVLRLFPALVVVLLLTVAVLGPLATALPFGDYASSRETLTYLPRNLSLAFLQYELPGVFAANPYPGAINGPLWTLVHEVLCYAGVLIVGLLGALAANRRGLAVAVCYGVAVLAVWAWRDAAPYKLVKFAELSLPFAIGVGFYLMRRRLRLSWAVLAALAALAAALSGAAAFHPAMVLALSYGVFLLAYCVGGGVRAFNRLGDYSYGVYIYAFPFQQLVAWSLAPGSVPLAIAAAAVPTLAAAILSWHLIEKPSLARKSALGDWLARCFGGRMARAGRLGPGPW